MRLLQTSIILVVLMLNSCNSSKEASKSMALDLQEKPSFKLDQVYFQKWVAGIQGGGSGIHMYILIETNENRVAFDSVYFRGMQANIQLGKIGYLASFKTPLNQKEDIIMDSDSKQEYGNKPPKLDENYPFNLKENECVIQYTENGKTKYFKVTNVIEKQVEQYPSAPPNKEKQ